MPRAVLVQVKRQMLQFKFRQYFLGDSLKLWLLCVFAAGPAASARDMW